MSAVEIKRAVFRDVAFVAAHMRDEDAHEIYCQFPEGATSVDVAALSYANTEHAYCAWHAGSPVAAFGFSSATPAGTVYSAWLFGTRGMTRVIPAITRFGVGTVSTQLIRDGVRRVEVRSMEGHDIAHRWLARLGARREAALCQWGRGGETFFLWSWTLDDWRKAHVFQSEDAEDSTETQSGDP